MPWPATTAMSVALRYCFTCGIAHWSSTCKALMCRARGTHVYFADTCDSAFPRPLLTSQSLLEKGNVCHMPTSWCSFHAWLSLLRVKSRQAVMMSACCASGRCAPSRSFTRRMHTFCALL